jgi:7SK snRNA methylphosphate capping enzyme
MIHKLIQHSLSVTKWIHLHHGDDGIRSFFYKVYASLRAGGRFILEPQSWSSYARKSKLTPVSIYYLNTKTYH